MRLDKFIAGVTDLSRVQAKYAIRDARVQVDGEPATGPDQQIGEAAQVSLDGRRLATPGPRYFMLHKPLDCVCAARDREHMTVLQLLDEPNLERLHVAGRLDIDTTGLVLLTDDGQWSHRITSPRHACEKIYRVQTADPIPAATIASFATGVFLRDEKRRTLPATLEILGERSARLTLQEGRYHQVKRMFAAAGNRVVALHREQVAGIALDPALAPGEYRPLTAAEVAAVSSGPRQAAAAPHTDQGTHHD